MLTLNKHNIVCFISLLGLASDIRESNNRKRNSVKINLWNPTRGKKLVIPYTFASSIRPEIKKAIETAIKAMNKHLQCDHQAWVPFNRKLHGVNGHHIEFINDDGYI